MRNYRVRLIAEIGLAVALSIALNAIFTYLIPIRLPQGGSVSLIMLPIVLIALLRGPLAGILTGVLVGFTDLLFGPYVISLPQMLLDYPIAYGMVGLAGLFSLKRQSMRTAAATNLALIAVFATVVGGLGRLVAHVLSGVIFFGQYAPDLQNVWVYSLLYNASFIAPSIVIVAVAAALCYPLLRTVILPQKA